MKILLVGEYSNVHWTLAKGLRELGHEAFVIADGDTWKNYQRDIDLNDRSFFDKAYTSINYRIFNYRLPAEHSVKLLQNVVKKKFDVVQFINPVFIADNPEFLLYLYRMIRKVSEKTFLGAFGDDYYFVSACLNGHLRYSPLTPLMRDASLKDKYSYSLRYITPPYEKLNRYMANGCNGIIAPVIEYKIGYDFEFKDKTELIPFPFDVNDANNSPNIVTDDRVRFVHGVQRGREYIKGTNIIKKSVQVAKQRFGNQIEFSTSEDMPFDLYRNYIRQFNATFDQVYSFSQGMNALQVLASGRVCLAGNDKEFKDATGILDCPVLNITEDIDQNVFQIERVINYRDKMQEYGDACHEYIVVRHNYKEVAARYLDFWGKM